MNILPGIEKAKEIAFDNFRQKIILIANMSLSDPETSYNKAVLELKRLA